MHQIFFHDFLHLKKSIILHFNLSPQVSLDITVFMGDVIKSLLRNERNQQIMCDAHFTHELLSHGSAALADESHPLHSHLQYMFERLASQSLTPRDLR